jgi:HK97 family phage prohead protease
MRIQTMAKRDSRVEFRRGFPCELRAQAGESGELVLDGVAAVFDSETTIGGMFREVIRSGAFSKTLGESDQLALVNHDTTRTLARRSAGTLDLSESDDGLPATIRMSDQITDHRDTFLRTERKEYKGMSFGFEVVKDRWTRARSDEELDLREILEVRLFEVSPTPFPAYEATELQARSVYEAGSEDRATDEPGHDHSTTEPGEDHSAADLAKRQAQRNRRIRMIEMRIIT